MKKMRLLAWLLIMAMLSAVCPALGEESEIELADEAAVEAMDDIEVEADEDVLDLADPGDMAEDIAVDLSDLALSGDLDAGLDEGLDEGAEANNDDPQALVKVWQSGQGSDNEALFAGYVDLLFGKKDPLGLKPNAGAGEQLKGVAAEIYDYLLGQIRKVAAGTRSSTKIVIPSSIVPDYDAAVVASDTFHQCVGALIMNCPYHMFWYEETLGCRFSYDNGVVTYSFAVAKAYASGAYTTNAKKIQAAHIAVTNAKNVVRSYADASDYEKLCGYRDYICKAVSYNTAAAEQMDTYNINAWQLIWAFDEDPKTNIVCEGYAKAFQYLCDLSDFKSGIQCHIVTGKVEQEYGSGLHMWNAITMGDGKNYHVDITFVDTGLPEAFLCGASATKQKYRYCVRNVVYYTFDSQTTGAYPARLLKLSARDFNPDSYDESADSKTDLSDCKFTVKKQVYTGHALKPSIMVMHGNKTLVRDIDYTVSFDNNKDVGTATATIEGRGLYTGTKKVTFKIVPPSVSIKKLKAGKKSFTVKWKKGKGNTGYQIQYSRKRSFSGAKSVKVTRANTLSTTVKSLSSGRKYYVRVRAYKTVNSKKYYSAWSSVKSVNVK